MSVVPVGEGNGSGPRMLLSATAYSRANAALPECRWEAAAILPGIGASSDSARYVGRARPVADLTDSQHTSVGKIRRLANLRIHLRSGSHSRSEGQYSSVS